MSLIKWLAMILASAVLLSQVGCNVNLPRIVSGSGRIETRDFDLVGFNGIRAGSAFTVQVNKGESYKVQVTADDNIWNEFDISVTGTTLNIGTRTGVTFTNATLRATVTLPAIGSLDLSGASRVTVSPFTSENSLFCTVSGASKLNIENMKSGSTVISVSGASEVTGNGTMTDGKFVLTGASKLNLNGSGTNASVEASGASFVKLDQFKTQTVSVTISGASQARINTQNITQADLSGASHLYYVDSPAMGNIQTSGASTISKE